MADAPDRVAPQRARVTEERPGVITSRGESDTIAAGREVGRQLRGGEVLLLFGELGAGKTAFVRGLAEGLGVDPADVSSPTFTIVQEYRGRLRLQHADLYRLTPAEVDDLGLDDLLDGNTVMAVEWAERWASPPPGGVPVRFTHAGEDVRDIVIG
jgi:tRNA threonylcarbamoyladenosine biosynthesis protein TsaE